MIPINKSNNLGIHGLDREGRNAVDLETIVRVCVRKRSKSKYINHLVTVMLTLTL